MEPKKMHSTNNKSKHKKVKGNEKDGDIFARYFVITVLVGIVAIAILVSAFQIGVYEKKEWMKVAEGLKRPDRLVMPTRGTIYSHDYKVMAANHPQYYLYMDFKSSAILLDSLLHSKYNNVDSLAYYLSRKLKNRTPADYKAHILKGVQSKKTDYPLYVEQGISLEDLKEIKKFPFFRLGIYRNGLHEKERMYRRKPFGKLALRTIGDIYNEIDEKTGLTKGRSGLELQYDSLLRGEAGSSSEQRVGGRWTSIIEDEPINGMDIRTTIDIQIQDIVEKTLTDKLKELDAESGIAMIMEVKTGEIKAITNLTRSGSGRYNEIKNHAVADEIEPGSTFKVAAMMVALEDGVVSPKTPIDVGKGIYKYNNRTVTDHNANRGGYGLINAEKAIWYSSNVAMAKIILSGYERNPQKFLNGLSRIGIDADLGIDIPGAGKPKIRKPGDKLWSRYSLPWMSFGYEVQIPPIQMLTFYNAIANNGAMVRPMFVKEILKDGKSVKRFQPEVVIQEICTKDNLKIIQDMLYNVVNYSDPTPANRDGTGKPARSDVITISGKTGTAQIASGGAYGSGGHTVSFCGYFPYEQPLYSCIVVITRPRVGTVSGGAMCGVVMKEIAEKLYSNRTFFDLKKISADATRTLFPEVQNGDYLALTNVTKGLNIQTNGNIKSDYIIANCDSKGITVKELPINASVVPNVTGMGVKDAVYALENCGLRVSVSGYGSVTSQSIASGSRAVPGQAVTVTLN